LATTFRKRAQVGEAYLKTVIHQARDKRQGPKEQHQEDDGNVACACPKSSACIAFATMIIVHRVDYVIEECEILDAVSHSILRLDMV
jgi:hypothetical protein